MLLAKGAEKSQGTNIGNVVAAAAECWTFWKQVGVCCLHSVQFDHINNTLDKLCSVAAAICHKLNELYTLAIILA